MIHVPKRLALFMMGIGGLFGMRTPPDPEVTAQRQPAKPPTGRTPPAGDAGELLTRLSVKRPGPPEDGPDVEEPASRSS